MKTCAMKTCATKTCATKTCATKTCAMLVLVATAFGSVAASAADPDHGRTLARRWCATCHVVASNQKRATGEAPPFATIAKRSDFNTTRLTNFLLDPHPKMPNMSLTRTEAADLAAYIATLAR